MSDEIEAYREVLNWACEQPVEHTLDRLILLLLAIDYDTRPYTLRELMGKTDRSRSSILKSIVRLRDSGLVRVIKRHADDGAQEESWYEIAMEYAA